MKMRFDLIALKYTKLMIDLRVLNKHNTGL